VKKIAIAGGGLAGLSVAWHLLQKKSVSVTLFDPNGIGGGASGVSTGLLHPFPGKRALHSWRADEGMQKTRELIEKVEEDSGKTVCQRGGILRLALTGEQEAVFQTCIQFGCEWWPKEKVVEYVPGAVEVPALWIPEGMTVYSMPYLEGLWRLCEKNGASFRREAFTDADGFDSAILAMGWQTSGKMPKSFQEDLKITRGQALICRWPKPLSCTLLSQGHLTSTEMPERCQLGSTYEDPNNPREESRALALREKIADFYPPALAFEIVETRVGYRISRNLGYRPILSQINPKTWAFFGLGSRGLLYHALLGEELADQIIPVTKNNVKL